MEQSSKDLSEAAYEEQENLEQDSFLDAPVAADDITIETPTTAIDDEIPTKIRVSNLYNEINKSRSALIALPTTTSAGRSSEEEAEEEEENMYMELGKLPSSADPEKMAKLQERLSQLAEEQMRSFRRSGLQKANMKKQPKPRNKNYSSTEDEAIARSWLAVSEDVTSSNNQFGGGLWSRIYNHFSTLMGFENSERTPNGLTCRWQVIQREVGKFCGLVAQVERTNKTKMKPPDQVIEAKRVYRVKENTEFKFEGCWRILKDNPKWSEFMLSKSTKKPKLSVEVQNPSQCLDGSNNDDTSPSSTPTTTNSESVPPEGDIEPFTPGADQDETECPSELKGMDPEETESIAERKGIDKDKIVFPPERKVGEKRKNINNDQTVVVMQELLNVFQASLQQQHQLSLREIQFREEIALRDLQLREEQARRKRYKDDQEIMLKDLSGLNPYQKEFFMAKQREIWKRWRREGQLPPGPGGGECGRSSEENFTNESEGNLGDE